MKLKLKENASGSSYQDRLQKIIKRPSNIPNNPPASLGSPSDRGPSSVPPIKKEDCGVLPDGSAYLTAMVGKAKKKKKMKKESLGQNVPDIGALQTETVTIEMTTFLKLLEAAKKLREDAIETPQDRFKKILKNLQKPSPDKPVITDTDSEQPPKKQDWPAIIGIRG